MPGIKIGRSKARLPLKVEVEKIPVPDSFTQTLNNHLLLVYTGKTRLARNLLQVTPGCPWVLQALASAPPVAFGACPLCWCRALPPQRELAPKAAGAALPPWVLLEPGGWRQGRSGLLQDVVRNWYARLPSTVQNADALVSSAEECAQALRQGVSPLSWVRPTLLTTEETQTSLRRLCAVPGVKRLGGCRLLQLQMSQIFPLAHYRQWPKIQA